MIKIVIVVPTFETIYPDTFQVIWDLKKPEGALINMLDDDKDIVTGYYAHRVFNAKYDGRTNACKLGEFNYTNIAA